MKHRRSPLLVLSGAAVSAMALVLLSTAATAAAPAGRVETDEAKVVRCEPAPPTSSVPKPTHVPGKPPLETGPTTAPTGDVTVDPVPTPPASAGATAADTLGWGTPIPEASDDFNGAALDQAKWSVYDGAGHDGNGRRTPDQVAIEDGKLVLTGTAGGDSAGLASTFDQRYGRWEARVRTETADPSGARQYHPLLIIWPESNRWPQDAEYDFFENPAPGLDRIEAFLHYPNHQPKRQEHARLDGVDTTQWQNIAFEWTPTHVTGFVNGVEWFSFSGNNITGMPSGHLTIQLDNFHGAGMTPARYEIDHVNTYRLG